MMVVLSLILVTQCLLEIHSKVVEGFDVVIDALDSVDARYAINDACIKFNIPFIYAGALGMLGSVCTILPNKSACLRCLFPALADEDMPTCSTEGVHPSVLYLVAGVQVSEAVKIQGPMQQMSKDLLAKVSTTKAAAK